MQSPLMTDEEQAAQGRHFRVPFRRSIGLLTALFVLLLVGGNAVQLGLEYLNALDASAQSTGNLAAVLEEYTRQTFESIDHQLDDLVRSLPPDPFGRGFNAAAVSARLDEVARRDRAIARVRLYGPRGMLRADSAGAPKQELNPLEREDFLFHRDHASAGLYVGLPFREGNQWVYPLSRRIEGPGHAFAGMAVAELEPLFLQQFFRSVHFDHEGAISLMRKDGYVLLRFPDLPNAVGYRGTGDPYFSKQMAGLDHGEAMARSVLDGVERIGYFRTVADLPLIVAVSQSRQGALAPWWSTVRRDIAIMGCVLLAVAVLVVVVYRQQASLERTQAATRRMETHMQLRMQAILANAPGVVFERMEEGGQPGRFAFVSQGAQELFGVNPEAVLADADSIAQQALPEERPALAQSLAKSVAEGSEWHHEFRILRPDGSVAWVRGSARLRRSGPAQRIWDGIFVDITRQKAADEQLRAAQRMEALGHLTGGVAHEFNNLLMAIQGNLELLEEGVGDPKEAASSAMASAQRGADLTQRLLAFARRQSLQPQQQDPNRIMQDLIDLLRGILGERVKVEPHLDARPWPIRCDRRRLENALITLAVNAKEAMPDGGTLRLATANTRLAAGQADCPAGDYVSIAVADTGAGMDPEAVRHAFDPFFSTKAVGHGAGLGLSTVYGFVKQSGGDVAIRSGIGDGTVVTMYFPRVG